MAESHRTGQVRRYGNGSRMRVRWTHAVRLLGVVTVLLGCTGIAAAGVAQASQLRTAAGSAWKIEPTPNQAGANINEFSAVSCTSKRACTAVGSHAASLSSPSFTLAERWNGTSWRIQPTILPKGAASSTFTGVSCGSASACTAVGGALHKATGVGVNLAEAWNGRRWRVQAIANPKGATDGELYAVFCTSPDACTAVGHYDNAAGRVLAVVERWNGTTWRIQAIPRPAKLTWLFGVSCSAARACTAVGYQNTGTGDAQPLAEAWNGTKWHVQAVPLPHGAPGGALSAVSCTSPSACTATGTNFGTTAPTLAERWNGKRWRVQPTPNPPNFGTSMGEVALHAVSCASATACIASGGYTPGGQAEYFIEAWNGRDWRMVTAAHPADFTQGALNGMSCALARCTAVGAWSGGAVPVATLAMANWSRIEGNPAGAIWLQEAAIPPELARFTSA